VDINPTALTDVTGKIRQYSAERQLYRNQSFILEPNVFVIASTSESVHLSNSMAARKEGKSSLARFGVQAHLFVLGMAIACLYNQWLLRIPAGTQIGLSAMRNSWNEKYSPLAPIRLAPEGWDLCLPGLALQEGEARRQAE